MSKHNTIAHRLNRVVQDMPHKTIEVDGEIYLRRYYAGTTGDTDLWLHRIFRPDVRHLHNHPFTASSMVLTGGYLEERILEAVWRLPTERVRDGVEDALAQLELRNLAQVYHCARICGHSITPFDFHRIARLRGPGPVWTLLAVDHARLPYWYFKEPGEPYRAMPASPVDWWRNYL